MTNILLTRVDHPLLGLVLLIVDTSAKLCLAELGFLLLLDDGAETAAARQGNIGKAAALEVVLAADFGTLHNQGNDRKANAGRTGKEETRCVDWLVSLEVAILVETVVGFAECDAGQTPGNQAGVDWVVESEDGIVEGLSGFRGLRVDSLAGLGEEFAEALAPSGHIFIINWSGFLRRGGHCSSS